MTTVNRSAIVPFTSAQMYQLVDDIPRYSEFLPWCKKAEEHRRMPDEVEASLTLSWNGIEKVFTTRNHLSSNEKIRMELVEGPFKHLEGLWTFSSLKEGTEERGCKIELCLEFEFSNPLMSLMFSKVFEGISQDMVGCFIARAKEKYGSY